MREPGGNTRGFLEMSAASYDPRTTQYLCFAEAREAFLNGRDTPRDYLERCLDRIEQHDSRIKAFVRLNADKARKQADLSTQRYRDGRPLSPVDGLPVGIKDCYETVDMPTEVNSPLFVGWESGRDAAHVYALRRGGAAIVGKTVTTELTIALPGPTVNPWDESRTPGGSSSGSAAAVAARMLPVATGSQVRGSVIRPASICGVIGMKPTYGAVNRGGGFDVTPSYAHFGILAGTLTDAWETACYIARTAGGDPGHRGLYGGPKLPQPEKPLRLARQYTYGWQLTDAVSKQVFEELLTRIARLGIEIIEPTAGPEYQAYEDATRRSPDEFFFDVLAWERWWPMLGYRDRHPDGLSAGVRALLARTEIMTLDDYRRALDRCDALRNLHRQLKPNVDGFITLAHIGPGQKGMVAQGTPWYNDPSSAIGAPTINLPLLAVEGVPLGVQLMGFEHEDERLVALAAWLIREFGSTAAGVI